MAADKKQGTQPPQLDYFYVYKPDLSKSEHDEHEQILYQYATAEYDQNAQLKHVGIARALAIFAGTFASENRFDAVRSRQSAMFQIEPEPGIFLLANISLGYTARPVKADVGKTEIVYNSTTVIDASIHALLNNAYAAFRLRHGILTNVLAESVAQGRQLLQACFSTILPDWNVGDLDIHDCLNGIVMLPLSRTSHTISHALLRDLKVDFPSVLGGLLLWKGRLVHSDVEDLDDKRALWHMMRRRYEAERAHDMLKYDHHADAKEEAAGFSFKTLNPLNLFRNVFASTSSTAANGTIEDLPPGVVEHDSVDVDDMPRLPPIQSLPPIMLNGHGEPAETTVTVDPPVHDEPEVPGTPDSETRFLVETDRQLLTVYLGPEARPHSLYLYQCQTHLLVGLLFPQDGPDVNSIHAELATSIRPPLEAIAEQVGAERLWITHVRNDRLEQFRFVHLDRRTLRIQTTLKRRRPKAEVAACLGKFMSDFDARKDARDLCARLSESGYWVIARRDEKRHVFLVVERKDATLVQAEDEFRRFSNIDLSQIITDR